MIEFIPSEPFDFAQGRPVQEKGESRDDSISISTSKEAPGDVSSCPRAPLGRKNRNVPFVRVGERGGGHVAPFSFNGKCLALPRIL